MSAPRFISALLIGLVVMEVTLQADDAASIAFFEAKIRPVLVKHCYECHSAESGKSKGGLVLDTKQGTLAGGDTGPAVVPGDPTKSLMLTAIKHADADLAMPPKKPKLAQAMIADVEAWIKSGAIDPREASTSAKERPPVDLEAGRQFWSYQKPKASALPENRNQAWAKRDLDRFVLAKLEEHKLTPTADAEPVVFLRRLSFDLIGLPPSPEETVLFVQQWEAARLGDKGTIRQGEVAKEAVSLSKNLKVSGSLAISREGLIQATVDRLLQSPRFGERWGRHWLDVARYAESNGREANLTFPHAWRYRDYVIDAVNADVSFDRFITEQIAGDLLPAKNDGERARLLIATGFLAIGAKGLGEFNKQQFDADVADEQLDAVSRAVLGSSIACARCHDHKTDPFSMEDYYALAGIFKSTKTFFGNWVDSENNNHGNLIRLPELSDQLVPNKPVTLERIEHLKSELTRFEREEKEDNDFTRKAKQEGRDVGGEYNRLLQRAIGRYWQRGGIEGELERVDETGRALPLCMGVLDDKVQNSPLYERGEIAHPGTAVARGFPRVLQLPGIEVSSDKMSGRLQLARWLASRDNPLTARVMANRVWRYLMGAGIVRTTDNFGFSGERPSHPELLDYLALKFMDSGWSVKSLVREVVLSRTYRQASTYRADAFKDDPDNRLMWRANKRRLDAEVIRDSMLAVSGLLDVSRRPGSLVAELDGQSVALIGFNTKIPADLDGSHRRSIYLPVIRDHLPDVLEQFDAANPNLVTGDRDVTNVPLQALYLMNGVWVQQQANALAQRVMAKASATEARLGYAFELCFNRQPDAVEASLADAFCQQARGMLPESPAREQQIMAAYCQSLLASGEFRYAD